MYGCTTFWLQCLEFLSFRVVVTLRVAPGINFSIVPFLRGAQRTLLSTSTALQGRQKSYIAAHRRIPNFAIIGFSNQIGKVQ